MTYYIKEGRIIKTYWRNNLYISTCKFFM